MKVHSILVADDNSAFRSTLEQVLNAEGFEVSSAADGEEALQSFKEREFDLILLDIVMPNKEGFETMEEMLKLKPDQAVIVMTGGNRWVSNFYLESAKERGAIAVLGKPFPMRKLFDEIDKIREN